MTHNELLATLIDKIPKMNVFDVEILKDIVAGIAKKDNSLYDFYRELSTSGEFLDIALVEKIAQKYTVPSMYREHVDKRFDLFKENLKIVTLKNKEAIADGKKEGLNPDNWVRDGVKMFGSTEKHAIEKAGGLGSIRASIMNFGYFEYLKSIFENSATEISKSKYSLIMKNNQKQIGG